MKFQHLDRRALTSSPEFRPFRGSILPRLCFDCFNTFETPSKVENSRYGTYKYMGNIQAHGPPRERKVAVPEGDIHRFVLSQTDGGAPDYHISQGYVLLVSMM